MFISWTKMHSEPGYYFFTDYAFKQLTKPNSIITILAIKLYED